MLQPFNAQMNTLRTAEGASLGLMCAIRITDRRDRQETDPYLGSFVRGWRRGGGAEPDPQMSMPMRLRRTKRSAAASRSACVEPWCSNSSSAHSIWSAVCMRSGRRRALTSSKALRKV